MADEELAEIERRFQSRIGTDKFLTIFDRDMKDLIAEVRRLKAEAETVEVLREWLAAGDINTYRERWIADQKQGHWPADRVELAKRRVAALEGK